MFFDGGCFLCLGTVRWLNRLDVKDQLCFAPLDGVTAGECGIDNQDEDSVALFYDGAVYRSSEALRLTLAQVGGVGYVISGILKVIPFALREWVYRWVARNRRVLVKRSCGADLEEGMLGKLLS